MVAVGALVVLPALLAVLGRRVDRLRLPIRRRRATRPSGGARPTGEPQGAAPDPSGGGFWHRLATGVMRRPLPIAVVVVAFLLLLGTPFLGVRFGLPDDRVLLAGAASRQVADALRTGFAADESSALSVVATGIGDPTGRLPDIDRYAAALSRLDDVRRVDALWWPACGRSRPRSASRSPARRRSSSTPRRHWPRTCLPPPRSSPPSPSCCCS